MLKQGRACNSSFVKQPIGMLIPWRAVWVAKVCCHTPEAWKSSRSLVFLSDHFSYNMLNVLMELWPNDNKSLLPTTASRLCNIYLVNSNLRCVRLELNLWNRIIFVFSLSLRILFLTNGLDLFASCVFGQPDKYYIRYTVYKIYTNIYTNFICQK